jgi:hypothetical protein
MTRIRMWSCDLVVSGGKAGDGRGRDLAGWGGVIGGKGKMRVKKGIWREGGGKGSRRDGKVGTMDRSVSLGFEYF